MLAAARSINSAPSGRSGAAISLALLLAAPVPTDLDARGRVGRLLDMSILVGEVFSVAAFISPFSSSDNITFHIKSLSQKCKRGCQNIWKL